MRWEWYLSRSGSREEPKMKTAEKHAASDLRCAVHTSV